MAPSEAYFPISMTYLISSESLDAVWLRAVGYLRLQPRHEEYGLIVEAISSQVCDSQVVDALNTLLISKRKQTVQTVANTIFPQVIADTSASRDELYARYLALISRLRRFGSNQKGTYFQRLIAYPTCEEEGSVNQLERIVTDLLRERRLLAEGRSGAKRFIYEANIFAASRDHVPIGFPCMSSLSFQLDGEFLRLTATYRNQYYISRALGNLLGLSRLQQFVAGAADLKAGAIIIHACHAELGPGFSNTDVERLVTAY
jgi:hypothetical protein